MEIKAPWLRHYGTVPHSLVYPDCSISDLVFRTAKQYPDVTALDFFGVKTSYAQLADQIDLCARALKALGIGEGDKVTICMPNTPQAVTLFYAVNRIGAVANMIHPLSAEGEIAFYLKSSESVAALTLSQFYPKFEAIAGAFNLKTLIVAGIEDGLSGVKRTGYQLTKGRKIPAVPVRNNIVRWADFLKAGRAYQGAYACRKRETTRRRFSTAAVRPA